MKLTSSTLQAGKPIPDLFTCEGADRSPDLAWSGVPAGTKSFALICSDPDAPSGTFYHWALFNLPAATDRLEQGQQATAGAIAATNDFGKLGYSGPCPPKGHGVHHYRFRLTALDVERLPLGKSASCRAVEALAAKHALAEADLTVTYQRAK